MDRKLFLLLGIALAAPPFSPIILRSADANQSITAANWPQWRGPDSSGVSAEKNVPAEWSATQNILWKTPIPGKGHSSPIVWGDKVFLTTAIQGALLPDAQAVKHTTVQGGVFDHEDAVGAEYSQTFKVICLDAATGKVLWEQTAYEGKAFDDHHRKSSYASPTPVTDGKYVYAYFGSEGLYCYDLDGRLVWKKSLGGIATMGMGVASSPVLWEDLLILQCDQDNGVNSFVAAINRQNSEEVWRVPRTALESWTTPIVVRASQRSELIVNAREVVIAHDPATGKELWRSDGVGSNPVPTPVTGHNLVIVAAGAGKKHAKAIRLDGSANPSGSPDIAWQYFKGTAHIASPILYGDYLYLLTDHGIITCLDAKTGSELYRDRIPGSVYFTASPVAVDGKILFTTEEGDTFVVKAGPSFELLGKNSIGEAVYASPAIAGGKIFLRGEQNLYAIGRTN